jgi:hypothetical protein
MSSYVVSPANRTTPEGTRAGWIVDLVSKSGRHNARHFPASVLYETRELAEAEAARLGSIPIDTPKCLKDHPARSARPT